MVIPIDDSCFHRWYAIDESLESPIDKNNQYVPQNDCIIPKISEWYYVWSQKLLPLMMVSDDGDILLSQKTFSW